MRDKNKIVAFFPTNTFVVDFKSAQITDPEAKILQDNLVSISPGMLQFSPTINENLEIVCLAPLMKMLKCTITVNVVDAKGDIIMVQEYADCKVQSPNFMPFLHLDYSNANYADNLCVEFTYKELKIQPARMKPFKINV